jgi:hypothetical protein
MRARRLGSRRASHLIDVERKRSCTGSVHSSGSFCTKLENLALRTPPSWLAAGAPGRMPAVRRPAMHHSSLCAGAYLKGHRETRFGGVSGVWGTLESPGEKWGKKWLPFFPPRALIARARARIDGSREGGQGRANWLARCPRVPPARARCSVEEPNSALVPPGGISHLRTARWHLALAHCVW